MISTNTIEKVLSHDNHWRPENVTFSVSEMASSSQYQLWLGYNKTPRTHEQELSLKVNSAIGTGFHKLAEEALANEQDVILEAKFIRLFDGKHWISGSCDVIRENTEWGVVFEDHKTKGVYQAKKAFQGDLEDVALQLSIYRYLYWMGTPDAKLCDYGLVNILVTGDTGYYNKADGGGQVEKYKQVPVKLMSLERTKKYIEHCIAIGSGEEPVMDCDSWRCSYCSYQCNHRRG